MVYSELIEDSHLGFINHLYYFNLKSRQRRLLTTGLLAGQMHWHRNGWILIPCHHRIVKIKANGNNFTELVAYQSNAGATWNPKGDQFAFYKHQNDTTLHIADANTGSILDTILELPTDYPFLFDWSKTDVFIRQTRNGLVSYNRKTQQQDLLVSIGNECVGFCGLDDGRTMVFSTYSSGLFVTNTVTKKIKKIQCGCQTIEYRNPVYVPQLRKIYALKTVSKITDPPQNTHVLVTTFLVIMNLDGSDEQIIDLPQQFIK